MELLPTEILFDIVEHLCNRETKTLSLVSKRVRDVCLPVLFRKINIEFSTEGFDLLESLLKSSIRRYIVSFQYIVPKLVKPQIRNYEIFRTEILTPGQYVEACEYHDDVDSYEDWDEMEYVSGDQPSYTRMYKTIRRTCARQQEIIEARRDSTLMKLAFQQLSNLKELVLVFSQAQGDEDWEEEYQEEYANLSKGFSSPVSNILPTLWWKAHIRTL
ncbi:uncharacterized protein ANIA_11158 [Aspergillus nidulans FGSC A4]|uniref:F-box domain-containing protein n=1 Tax=Emericella nidulans (strain FGSC A4 / ATCC 38163 / CBS 112.46 / NRRL 194 / M139) TaxID=227321 RepID=C8VKY4_EMENI|nr:hypothetical protein [Aspergillus nidulans FGSC A4]CBF84454.1 TPA: conserved hypothetical protein [Aspergillus nidulans FGSC A4]